MNQHRDLVDMIEILTTAIVIHEKEEEFFRNSAKETSSEVAKSLFSEIAEDLNRYRQNLEERKRKLIDAMSDLEKMQLGEYERIKRGEAEVLRDPVCAMKVDVKTCPFVSSYKGKEYRFCSADCKKAFDLAPEKYVK